MPRYFFHVVDGRDYPDLQGTLLDNLQAARLEAVRFAGDLLSHNVESFWTGGEWTIQVADGTGKTLLTLKFLAIEHDGTAASASDQTSLGPPNAND